MEIMDMDKEGGGKRLRRNKCKSREEDQPEALAAEKYNRSNHGFQTTRSLEAKVGGKKQV